MYILFLNIDSIQNKEYSTTLPFQSCSSNNEHLKSDNNNFDNKKFNQSLIANLKSLSISNKYPNRNEIMKTYLNQISNHKKWSTLFLNSSKVVITEKDSKKEDSDRADITKSISNNGNTNNNNTIIVIENLMKTSESNFSNLKNRSKLSQFASEHSYHTDHDCTKKNTLKTNKDPKLLSLGSKVQSQLDSLNYSLTNLNKSYDPFHKYKFLFGDLEKTFKENSLKDDHKSLHKSMPKPRQLFNEEADLSIQNRNKISNYKTQNIVTFRNDVESLRNNNDIFGDDFIHFSENKIKRFYSKDFSN